jgi:hypothetical protein
MLTYKRISAVCSLGLVVAACGEPSTQPDTTTTSLQATPLLSTPVTGTWRKMPSIVPARAEMAAWWWADSTWADGSRGLR